VKLLFKIIGIVALIGVVLFIGRGFYPGEKGNKVANQVVERIKPVRTAPLKTGIIKYMVTTTGVIESAQRVIVTPEVGGKLEKVLVNEGEGVSKADVIAIIDQEKIKLGLVQAEAALKVAKANLKDIEINLSNLSTELLRVSNLFKEGVASKQSLDQLQTQHNSLLVKKELAEAGIEQARTNLKQAEIRLDDSIIKSPLDGIVTQRHLDAGNMVGPGTPIATIEQIDRVKVKVGVSSKELPKLAIGKPAFILIDAYPDKSFEAAISKIGPRIDQQTQTVEVEVAIPNQDLTLKPGMFARVDLLLKTHQGAVIIQRDIMIRMEDKYYVFVAGDKAARQRQVVIGIEQEERVEIIEGLKPGEMVIVSGQADLKDGSKIRIVKEGE